MLNRLSVAWLRPQWHMTGGAPLESLVSLVVPDYYHLFDPSRYVFPFNFTFMYLYCGIAGLLLAAAGLVAARRRVELSFALLAVVCGLWMLGSNTPGVGRLYGFIPDFIRGPMYAEFASVGFILGIASLAAFGTERFVVPRGKWAMAVLVASTVIDLTWHGADRPMNRARTIDVDTASPNQFEGSTSALKNVRGLTNTTLPPGRIDVLSGSRDWTMSASILGLQTAGGDEPLVPLRALKVRSCFTQGLDWERYYTVDRVDSPLLKLLNVRYLIAAEEQPLSGLGSQVVPKGAVGRHFLFENRNALPRFFLVGEVHNASDFEESLNEVCSPAFNPARAAVVEGSAFAIPAQLTSQGSVRVATYSSSSIELNVETPAPSFLVTSETAYPGWKAQINGAEAQLLMTNAAFRGIPVPAGRSHVRMTFFPEDLVGGLLLTAFSGILALVCLMRQDIRSQGEIR